jgi:membrane associated rhomboid family serine protease/outer membrane protein assembly factor BamD (BamD/ComL family)
MLLPYASDRPPKNPPIVVVTIVLIQFAMFGLIALIMSARGPGAAVALYANLSLAPAAFHWYAPLTYSFLHESVLHLSSNMLFLWVFGGSLEDAVGKKRFVSLYLGSAIITGILQCGMAGFLGGAARTIPIVGASGAISAIVGAFAVRFYRSRIRFIGLPVRVPAVLLVAGVMVGEMGVTLFQLTHRDAVASGHTAAHWAHIGGFILGVMWAQAMRLMRAGRHEYLAADAAMEMERGSPLTAVRRWEAVLDAQPDNLEAKAELGRAWATVGDREHSASNYKAAISGYLKASAKKEAAARYLEMTGFFSDEVMEPSEQFAIAGVLEEQGDSKQAEKAFTALLDKHPDCREAEMTQLRSCALLTRKLGCAEAAVARLETFHERYPDSEWRTFADDLLREAKAAIRNAD